MKIGLLFAGQGAQHTGMGKDLYDNSAAAKLLFNRAGEEIKGWCFEGTKETLKQTYVTQPSIYTVSMAAYEAFLEQIKTLSAGEQDAIEIVGMAGFSLGEYTALTAGGVITSFEEGLEIVRKRGSFMNEAGLDETGENRGGMIAAFGERAHILRCVDESRENDILEGVNFNSPSQTVVAGGKEALGRFRKMAKQEGIKAVPLSVSTAFHSSMMEPAAVRLQGLLEERDLQAPKTRLYSNVTGTDLMEGFSGNRKQWIASRMAKQAMSPVYWQEIIENMIKDGIQVLIEIGPGSTLSGLVKKISHEGIPLNIADYESLTETIKAIKEMIKREQSNLELVEKEVK